MARVRGGRRVVAPLLGSPKFQLKPVIEPPESGAVALPLKLTVEPGVVTATVGLMLTTGGSSTVIVWWVVAVCPASLVTVNVTV